MSQALIPLDHLSATCQTLLIPLSGRAYGSERFPNLGFTDLKAHEFASRIDYDRELFIGDRQAVWGTLLRTQSFDAITQEFMDRNPDGVVVNLGAGLCTRYFRLKPREVTWLELDLPEVIALKASLCQPTEKYQLLPFDLSSNVDWERLEGVLRKPTLVIAEGVLMFLQPEAVEQVFKRFTAMRMPELAFAFDYLHPLVMRHRFLQPLSFRATGASYTWAGAPIGHPLSRHPELRLLRDQALSERFPTHLKWLNRAVTAILGSSFYDIAHVERRSANSR